MDLRSLTSAGAARWCLTLALASVVATAVHRAFADEELVRSMATIAQRQPLIVGVTTDSFPYGYRGDDGQWTGFSVELLDAVARQMNLQIRRVAAPGKELQARFKAGEFDMMQALSQTEEREIYANFSVPYLTLQGTLFVQKRGTPIARLEDLNGRKFAVIGVGSIGEKFLADHHLKVQPVYVSSSEDALVLVDKGECVATIASYLTALAVSERAKLKNLEVFGRPFADYDIRHCYAVHRGDEQLLSRLNEGLAILQQNGEYDQIYRKWFGRFDSSGFTREQVVRYGLILLALGLVAALWALQRQRVLRKRIAGQSEELIRQQTVLQALYDNVPMAMCVLESHPDGRRLLSINRQAESLFRIPARQAPGVLLRTVPGDPEWLNLLGDVLARRPIEGAMVREERLLAESKRRIVVSVVPLSPVHEGRDRTCVLAEDVTASRALDEEVAQSRRLRAVGELVGGIAHEFNNLLTPVMLKVAEIRMDRENDARLRDDLRPISDAARRAADLTSRLLAFGRKGNAEAQDVNVADIVDGCVALLRSTFDRRITFSSLVPPRLPTVRINATDLNQVVLNLIINARDTLLEKLAIAPDGFAPHIRVEGVFQPVQTTVPDFAPVGHGFVRLSVSDNGMGIPREVRERIFEPFFTTKDVGKGSGLGLATVWHLITQNGGRVELESNPGEGSRFHILLPSGPRATVARSIEETTPTVSTGPARVFVGDDDDLVARAMVDSIQRAGHTVHRLANGAEAWEHLRTHAGDYDILVLDVNMPGLDGVELTRRLRGEGRYQGPILIVSGRLTSEQRRDLDAAPVSEILDKPFETGPLLDALGRCLRHQALA